MPTDYELKEAYEKGLKDGANAERDRLRTFTGLPHIVMPKTDLPEHLAYPEYERRLQDVLAVTEREDERLQERMARLTEAAATAIEALDEAVDAHRLERETLGAFGKLRSVVAEPFLREKTLAKEAETRVAETRQAIIENYAKKERVAAEYSAVTAWVEEMYTVTTAAGQSRAEDRVAAARDISSRSFKVFTMDEYLNGDERRKLQHIADVPAGEIFGARWRRDGDDRPSYEDGLWSVAWISENQETALFINAVYRPAEVWLLGDHIRTSREAEALFYPLLDRIDERNSLALVLDAYTEAYL